MPCSSSARFALPSPLTAPRHIPLTHPLANPHLCPWRSQHGNYTQNEYGQHQYPRYRFFKACTDVFKADGRSVPIFNDKHLSWKYAWAEEMVQESKDLGFAFMAGSSLPIAWRMPAVDMPYGAEVEEIMSVAYGGVDSCASNLLLPPPQSPNPGPHNRTRA